MEITSRTITLVPFAEEHLDNAFRWIRLPEIRRGILMDRTVDREGHRHWFESLAADEGQAVYAIVAGRVHVGCLGFRNIDRSHRRAEFWIYLGPEHQGLGYALPSVRAALEQAFEALGLEKVSLHVRLDNAVAIATYRKAGFAEEGMLKGEFRLGGERIDVLRMGCLKR